MLHGYNPPHRYLPYLSWTEIADLPDGDALSLARWVLDKGRAALPELDRVDLYETRGCGAIVIAATATQELVPV